MKTGTNQLYAWLREHKQVSENAIALTFAKEYGEKWRHDVDEVQWLQWVGTHWARSQTPELLDALRHFLAAFAKALRIAGIITQAEATKLQGHRSITAVERLCRNLPSFRARSALFDADPFLLGTPGGTVDLRDGQLWAADPEDYITILTPVTPAPAGTPAPRWQAFLDEVMGGNRDLQRTMQQWAGSSATGSARDQRIMFLYGSGRNGKGVFCGVIADLLGSHASGTMQDLFMEQKYSSGHPTKLVKAVTKRMVLADEIQEGAAWNTALIKELTGGGLMEIQAMRRDPVTVRPCCTITIQGNIKPEFKSIDAAIRDRFILVTFPVYIPPERRVADLDKKLVAAEGPAILRWVIDGAVDREKNGVLHIADISTTDTEAYFTEENVIAEFIETYLEKDPQKEVKTGEIYGYFTGFCGHLGRRAMSRQAFVSAMRVAGIGYRKSHSVGYFTGLGLKTSA
jgi:putative DNA primase/helicase